MNRPDEEFVRKRFEEERLFRERSNERSKSRLRVFAQVVVWLVAISFFAMTLGSLYWDYPMLLELIAGHQEGWVPTSFLVLWILLIAGLIIGAGALIVLAWRPRRSNGR